MQPAGTHTYQVGPKPVLGELGERRLALSKGTSEGSSVASEELSATDRDHEKACV